MRTLTQLIRLYPTIHRSSGTNIAAFCLRHLSGSSPCRTNLDVKCALAELYAILPLTGGKVGAINQWRHALNETLAFGWDSYLSLRTTFPIHGMFNIFNERILTSRQDKLFGLLLQAPILNSLYP